MVSTFLFAHSFVPLALLCCHLFYLLLSPSRYLKLVSKDESTKWLQEIFGCESRIARILLCRYIYRSRSMYISVHRSLPNWRNKLTKQNYSSPRYLIDAVSGAKEKIALDMLIGLCSSFHKMVFVISRDLVLARQSSETVHVKDFFSFYYKQETAL